MSATFTEVTANEPLNTALLLHMLDGAAPVWGRLKVQKTPFFVEYWLQGLDLTSSTFCFKRWKNGPFSQAVWDSLDHLIRYGFVQPGYSLTDRGLFLLDLTWALRDFADNREVFDAMETALRHCKTRSGQALMHEAYEIEIEPAGMPGETLKIRAIPPRVSILDPHESSLDIPVDLGKLIETELWTSVADLKDADSRSEQINRDAVQRLLAAIPDGPPS